MDRFLEFLEIKEENFKLYLKFFTSIDGNVVSSSCERLGNRSLIIVIEIKEENIKPRMALF